MRITAELRSHLDKITGRPVALDPARGVSEHLPVYLGNRYDFFRCRLFERDRLLAVWKGSIRPGIGELRSHAEKLSLDLNQEPILVLPELDPYERRRLLDWGIAFLIPGSQTYIPQALIDLRESRRGTLSFPGDHSGMLSSPAQLMLLFYLYNGSGVPISLSGWAGRLGYSTMSISRAQSELVERDLCEAIRRGRRLMVHFPDSKADLWQKARSMLFSPVQKRFTAVPPDRRHVPLALSGLSALAHYSGIGPGRIKTWALSGGQFRRAQRVGQVQLHPSAEEGDVLLEKWKYPPILLSGTEGVADRLSVCLSMRDDPDERVQAAIREVEESMKW